MEQFLAQIGLLFGLFLVLAAAVEVILESFRGLLGFFGFKFQKGKVSLDAALKQASEFSIDPKDLKVKLNAVTAAAGQLGATVTASITDFRELTGELEKATGIVSDAAPRLTALAAAVRERLDQSERNRILVLRIIAALFGCGLVMWSDFYVFRILIDTQGAPEWVKSLNGLKSAWVNVIVGGLAAAAGSSYWHDQLDSIRNLKTTAANLKQLGK